MRFCRFKSLLALLALSCAALCSGYGRVGDPFYPELAYQDGMLRVSFFCGKPGEHIYADMLLCSLGNPCQTPAQQTLDEDGRILYEGLAEFAWTAKPGDIFTLAYQGCDATQCHMPQELTFFIDLDGAVHEGRPLIDLPAAQHQKPTAAQPAAQESASPAAAAPVAAPAAPEAAPAAAEPAPVARSLSGFVSPEAFTAFLRGDASAADAEGEGASFFANPKAWVAANGLWLLIAVVFLGGLALNLTPCVLPMMPINLAIIGAGAVGGSRLRGALRGGAYGLGIALAYGVLALIPVLTGAAFGTIQSAWWFNAAIAAIFVALALALFDCFIIDFTRFSGQGSGKQGALAAFVAGAVSALLAGACVAPVLIAVLLLTADYVAAEQYWALCLPFVLGLGMAAPWPIAGAGLSFLPKPGAWMVWVKKVFGIVVLLFAAHYAWLAIQALRPAEGLSGSDLPALEQAIQEARAAGKPVLLDFWGPACKACEEMEAKTLPDSAVQAELRRFVFLKVRMDLADPAIAPTRKRFAIQGLPTYAIVE